MCIDELENHQTLTKIEDIPLEMVEKYVKHGQLIDKSGCVN